jgi:flagellar hook-associated protein 1 FlgK
MSILGLSVGLRGLRAAQAQLDTVGHNLSNANTPGYSRQRTDISAATPLRMGGILVGAGVDTHSVRRISDDLLNNRIRSQVSIAESYGIQLQGMTRIEELLSEPGENGLGSLFDGFFNSVARLSTEPGDDVLRNSMVQTGLNLTDEFNHLSSSLRDAREDNLQELSFHTDEANRLAEGILLLNREIVSIEASQQPANDLRDQREVQLRELAKQVDIQYSEQQSGAVHVMVAGRVLVGSQSVYELRLDQNDNGDPDLFIEGSSPPLNAGSGQIGGLLSFRDEFLPNLQSQLDDLARNMILEVNRAHSTGTPESGGFTLLSSEEAVPGESSAERLGTQLSSAGLPFEIQDGRLYVSLQDSSTGEVRTEAIDIDPERMSVQGLLTAFNEIDHMNAGLDSLGRLNLFSDSGFKFDFSARLDGEPDDAGSLGGSRATLGSTLGGPYNLAAGSTIVLDGGSGPISLAFATGDFADIANATSSEIANIINEDPAMTAGGVRAAAVGDRLVFQSLNGGSTETVAVAGGTSLGALGFNVGESATGRDTSTSVEAYGRYTGDTNRTVYYQPLGDGVIGSTPGLQIQVVSEDGSPVAVLDVGEGYVPGTHLDVGDGLEISFAFGEVSATNREVFKQDWIADSDSSDILAAFGVNSFFVGDGADSLGIATDIQENPSRLSYSSLGTTGDNGSLLKILSLQDTSSDAFGVSIPEFYSQVVGDVGFNIASTQSASAVADGLVSSLDARRQEVSGVNVDEELVDMIRYEQSYSAAARYIQVIQQLQDTVLSLI